MSDDFVKGLDGLLEMLKEIGPNLHKNAMRTATFRAAQEIVPELKKAAPVGGSSNPKGSKMAEKYPIGALKKGFRARRGRADEAGANAGIKGVFYAKFVEFGHTLKRRGGGKTKETIGHVPARPFIGPTFEAHKERLINVVRDNLLPEIKKQIDKARAKMAKIT
jgi:HK97 gp10 family phage protein